MEDGMDPIWLLKGPHDAPGWVSLESDARDDTRAP